MGRTIHYEIFGDLEEGPIPEDVRKRILEAQRKMNASFTWTCESLSLELSEHLQITYETRPPRPWAARSGWGFTKVRDDDWNAALIARFFSWVSTLLPTRAFVRLYDEGDYIVPGHILIHHGAISLDEVGLDRQRRYIEQSCPEHLETFERSAEEGRKGHWFAPVHFLEYQDRPEFTRARLPSRADEVHSMTLEDAADRVVLPWQTLESPEG